MSATMHCDLCGALEEWVWGDHRPLFLQEGATIRLHGDDTAVELELHVCHDCVHRTLYAACVDSDITKRSQWVSNAAFDRWKEPLPKWDDDSDGEGA